MVWIQPKPPPKFWRRTDLFQQVTNLFRALAQEEPLLLILNDLQWVDAASAALLFHLGRRLAGSRILIAGAYRPEEIAPRPANPRDPRTIPHPLRKVLAELQRQFGDVLLDLAAAQEPEGRHFVDSLLDAEPNHLGESFRSALFAHTGGHPLFTVELLRAMQEREDLIQDDGGAWLEGRTLDWDTLPPRVEGIVHARIGRLDNDLRDLLSVASVEGEAFTAQVVARVQGLSDRQGTAPAIPGAGAPPQTGPRVFCVIGGLPVAGAVPIWACPLSAVSVPGSW